MRGVREVCKRIQCPLLHSAKVCGLTTLVLTLWGLENNQVTLCTPMSTGIPVVAFSLSSLCLKKGGDKKGHRSKKEKTRDRTSLAALYSRYWGRSRHQLLGVSMSWVGLPRLPSMAPPRVETTCAYLSLSTLIIKLGRLPGKLGGEPSMHGTVGVSIGTRLTL
jgi:hypothetical protein